MIVIIDRALVVNAVTSAGALVAAYAAVGDRRAISIVLASTNNFIVVHRLSTRGYCAAPNAPVAKSETIFVKTKAPSTTARPIAE